MRSVSVHGVVTGTPELRNCAIASVPAPASVMSWSTSSMTAVGSRR